MEVEGEEGSNGAWVRHSSPVALLVLDLLIHQAASSDLLPPGTSGSSISSFHPLPVLRFGEGHTPPYTLGVRSVFSMFSAFLPPGQGGTGCGVGLQWGQAVGMWERCPHSVPLSLCIPALCWQLHPGEGQRSALTSGW